MLLLSPHRVRYVLAAVVPCVDEADVALREMAANMAVPGNKSLPRTQIIKKTLDPVWNETLEISLTEADANGGAELLLRVYDWDLGSSDDALGEITLSDLGRERVAPRWYVLLS